MALAVEVLMTFLPSKRAMSTFASQARIIQSASAISVAVRTFFAPPEPSVSTLIDRPSSAAAFSSPSAAMKVCAIPVGHAVTPRSV